MKTLNHKLQHDWWGAQRAVAVAVVLALGWLLATGSAGATNSAIATVAGARLLTPQPLFNAAHATVVSNHATAQVKVLITNANRDDFTVLVRDRGSYRIDTNALHMRAEALEVSVAAGVPYILKSKQPVRAVLSTNSVLLGGAAGMNNVPTNSIALRLVNDWRRFDALSGSYTSLIEVCFLSSGDVAGRYLPLTVKLYPSDGVAINERTLVLTNSGHGGCLETSVVCQDRKDNQITAESDVGDAILGISFHAEPFLYRILPRPVFWTTLVCGLVGSFVRVVRSNRKKKPALWVALELLIGLVTGFFLVSALWAGIGVGTIPVAAVGKLSGVAVVAAIGGYGGSVVLDFLLKKWFPPADANPS